MVIMMVIATVMTGWHVVKVNDGDNGSCGVINQRMKVMG